jgi:hypothetical protein
MPTTTCPLLANTKVPQPQDLVMEDFRKQFKLVANCKVSANGLIMTYEMQTLPSAARWLSEAQKIITGNAMPLAAGVHALRKSGSTEIENVLLRIVYTPK